jgi:alanyl aminopeptidase
MRTVIADPLWHAEVMAVAVRFARLGALVSACTFLACSALCADQPPTLRLPDTVAPTSYRVHLTLDTTKPTFSGSIAIQVNVKQPVETIWLNANQIDVEGASLETGGKKITAKAEPGGRDFLGLHFDSQVPAGPAEIQIRYAGKIRQHDSSAIFHMSENGNNYLFTQFENTDARAAFPCFDEPSYKAPWQLTLDIPQQNTAVSNTPAEDRETRGDRLIYRFKQTRPLPSYLVAFAVGPFDYVSAGTAGRNHVPVRIVTPKGHASEAKYAAENTATILSREEDYFGIPYPYEKLDNVAIPVTFGFGAMENAGMVTYAQDILLANPKGDTVKRQHYFALVAAHELAHQWSGDLVTTAWWNDIWLNEAFATWMEQKLVAEWKPEWHTRVDAVNDKLRAEAIDSVPSARKIRQEIRSNDDIANAFDEITYQKGAAVIGMFENWLGPEAFRKGVHNYLLKYAFKTATASDFLEAVSAATGKNVAQPFGTFLNQPGVPLVSIALDCNSGVPALKMTQQRYQTLGVKAPANELWGVPVCVRYGTAGVASNACTLMSEPSMNWKLDQAKGCPAWVEANANAVGYYRVNYGHDLLAALTIGDVATRLNAPERVDLIGDESALARGGIVPMGDALSLVGTFHADPEHDVVAEALNLALQPRLNLVPQNLEPNYQRFLRKNFDARARELGWTPKPGEPEDARLLRPSLVEPVAIYAGDRELAKQACTLADEWFKDSSAVDPNMVAAVLGTAADYGDKTLAERFIAEYKKTSDTQKRHRILEGMQHFRDPAALEASMQALLSGKIPMIDGYRLLFVGQLQPATRTLAFEFLKSHYAEIIAKLPAGSGDHLPRVGLGFCDAHSRDELQAFFQPHLKELVGATRMLNEVTDSINICVANKAAQQPSVVTFLEHY